MKRCTNFLQKMDFYKVEQKNAFTSMFGEVIERSSVICQARYHGT